MPAFRSADDILDFAIEQEQAAADFYTSLAKKMEAPNMKVIFEDFAKEEMGHKAKLESIKKGKEFSITAEKITDLKIGDYLTDAAPSADLKYQDALILAMKKEKEAFKLYTDLAGQSSGSLKALFLSLAQEEAKHKLRFEVEYDDRILVEN